MLMGASVMVMKPERPASWSDLGDQAEGGSVLSMAIQIPLAGLASDRPSFRGILRRLGEDRLVRQDVRCHFVSA